jgi:hypothetical protein
MFSALTASASVILDSTATTATKCSSAKTIAMLPRATEFARTDNAIASLASAVWNAKNKYLVKTIAMDMVCARMAAVSVTPGTKGPHVLNQYHVPVNAEAMELARMASAIVTQVRIPFFNQHLFSDIWIHSLNFCYFFLGKKLVCRLWRIRLLHGY